jgi:hypothetical protein
MPIRHRMMFGLIIAAGAVCAAQAETLAEAAARRFPQPVRVGDLLHRQVLRPLESQPSVGRVHTVVARADGAVEVVLEYGGIFGFFTRRIAVPADAMALLGEYMVMLGFTPEQLTALPDFTETGTTPLAADATIRVALAKPAH